MVSDEEEDDEEGEGGPGRRSGPRFPNDFKLGIYPILSYPAVSTSPPADSSGSIRHRRMLPRSLSAGWSAFKAAQKATWARSWLTSPTGAHLRAVTTSPPGLHGLSSSI
ncbi:hypothetical protein C6P46_003140 [Rhodotorula mucilaginosa]|uniref:Uncharacterized protein n=1 Tax=Rhodotorula mucilaginosa TaxID=5537 RepID=A0A9P7B0X6_RHOMI|nr:hypothetical protein C6P46_003140 [Rhodotorula mucilaginosa]